MGLSFNENFIKGQTIAFCGRKYIIAVMLKYYSMIFLISMVPLVELRGAIPIGFGWVQKTLSVQDGSSLLPPFYIFTIYATAIAGNMIPVPVIYFFARRFLEWGADKRFIGKICLFFLVKGKSAGQKLTSKAGRGIFVALLLFVGIPIPGTGAWTGTLAASLLDMNFRDTVIAVTLGVLLAGLIMMAGSFGLFSAIFSIAK